MIAAFDVHYLDAAEDPVAVAAAVVFSDWGDREAAATYLARVPSPAGYEPGQFFKRELPALRAVIDLVKEPIDTYVVDGYCTLSTDGAPGLGWYLREALREDSGRASRVVGVAKNRFRDTTHAAELLRGKSKRPLFVTASGGGVNEAAGWVEAMHGEHRVPTLLKAVDRLCRRG